MKMIDIFCASPASTAICLNIHQRSLVRQGSRIFENARLLEKQESTARLLEKQDSFENLNTADLFLQHRQQCKERSRKSTDDRRRKSNADYHHLPPIPPDSEEGSNNVADHHQQSEARLDEHRRQSGAARIDEHRRRSNTNNSDQPASGGFQEGGRKSSSADHPPKAVLEQASLRGFSRRKSSADHRQNAVAGVDSDKSKSIIKNVESRKSSASIVSANLSNNISLGRFSCSAIDQSAIVPFRPKNQILGHPGTPRISASAPVTPRVSSSSPDKIVALRVSLHCQGCAGKVRKHISKMEGVSWIHIDLPKQKVTVAGNVTPLAVLENVCRVKKAELWPTSKNS